MRIAVIADIHGNLPALEAVLAEIERRKSIARSTWAIAYLVRSGHVRSAICSWLGRPDHSWQPRSLGIRTRSVTYGCIGPICLLATQPDHRHWLAALPTSADADHGIFACHGTPTNDNQYLIEEVSEQRLVRAHPSTIRERLGDVQARVVLCGAQPPGRI